MLCKRLVTMVVWFVSVCGCVRARLWVCECVCVCHCKCELCVAFFHPKQWSPWRTHVYLHKSASCRLLLYLRPLAALEQSAQKLNTIHKGQEHKDQFDYTSLKETSITLGVLTTRRGLTMTAKASKHSSAPLLGEVSLTMEWCWPSATPKQVTCLWAQCIQEVA